MTTSEFSNSFDTLLNSYSSTGKYNDVSLNNEIRLDEYEKSIFLTTAQEEIIIGLYSGKNQFRDIFEGTEEARRYLDQLITTYKTTNSLVGYKGLSKDSIFYNIPEDVWFITYESVTFKDNNLECNNNEQALVVPITQDQFYKIYNNPFRGPSNRRVLRLDNKDNIVELVSKYNIDSYTIRYLSRPNPIVLIDLPDGLSINGFNKKTECRLNSATHKAILERAVQLAITSKIQLFVNNK